MSVEGNGDSDSIGSAQVEEVVSAANDSGTSLMPYGRIVEQVYGIQEVVVQRMSDLQNVAEIDLVGPLTEDIARIVAHRLRTDPRLTSIRVDECTSSTSFSIILQAIGDSTTLKQLRMDYSYLVDKCELTQALQQNQSIEFMSLYFMYDFTHVLQVMLSHSRSLQSLVLFECELDPHWELRLAQDLRNNCSLTELNITSPISSSDEETIEFLQSIRHLPLQKLQLSGFDFGINVQGFLGPVLDDLTSLHTLVLRRNGIQTAGVVSLANRLVKSQNLNRLDLSRDRIHQEGLEQFLTVAIPRLQELELNYAGLTNKSMAHLASLLPSSETLTSMSLIEFTPTCQRTSHGIDSLIQGLAMNYSLTSLNLWPDKGHLTINYYLRANRAKRGLLLLHGMQLPAALWPIIFEQTQRYGSDVLFGIL
jgi:hypothetical protein